MRGIRALGLAAVCFGVLALSAAPAHAAPGDYFPMEQGDTWTYENTRFGGQKTVTVTQTQTVSWGKVALFDDYWHDGQGRILVFYQDQIFEYEQATGQFWRTYVLDAAVGDTFNLRVAPPQSCLDGARGSVATRTETVRTPAGTFDDCVTFTYTGGGCADAGVVSETFAPGVGLVKRVTQSIAGPVEHVLVSGRVGSQTFPKPAAASGLTASINIDKFDYFENRMPVIGPTPRPTPVLTAKLVVKNDTGAPIDFVFNSGQSFDIVITDARGNVLKRWSDGRFFTQAIRQVTLADGDSLELTGTVDLGGIPDGTHAVEMHLTSGPSLGGTAAFRKSTVF